MALRPFKRALGETSLEKKCRWMFGVSLALLMTASFWWYSRQTDAIVAGRNQALCAVLAESVLAEIHVKWLADDKTKIKDYENILDDIRSIEPGWGVILPPNKENRYPVKTDDESQYLSECLSFGERQRDAIAANQPPEDEIAPFGRSWHVEGKRNYRHYQPYFAKPDCVWCHELNRRDNPLPNLKEGELMGIIHIVFDEKDTIEAQAKNRAIMIAAAFTTAFLSMIALYIIVRFVIVKPLKHLRDVSNAVREGDIEQRAHIKTGDEFEELGAAFNRMVRQLLSQQNELLKVNGALDHKLDELAEANLRLFEMNRVKSDFLSTVSHELRTPLNSILGFSDVLATNKELSEKQRRFAGNIQRSGRMLLEMITDILDLAKIESGKMDVRPTEFRVDALVIELCDLVRPLAEKKNIDLHYEIQPNMPAMVQDQPKLRQIFNNLLSNAIKFTPEGGRITVAVCCDDEGDLRVSVEDTGVGISKSEQQIVFEKFRQGQSVLPSGDTMTREYSGTGLGLSIVKELCRFLGGEVSLESELGRGSIFRVRLPWVHRQPPRLDASLVSELDDLTKPSLRAVRRPESPGEVASPTTPSNTSPAAAVPAPSEHPASSP